MNRKPGQVCGGENIYCIEVETALYDNPAVMDATVADMPQRTLGEEPGAVVCLTPGARASESKAEMRSWLSGTGDPAVKLVHRNFKVVRTGVGDKLPSD